MKADLCDHSIRNTISLTRKVVASNGKRHSFLHILHPKPTVLSLCEPRSNKVSCVCKWPMHKFTFHAVTVYSATGLIFWRFTPSCTTVVVSPFEFSVWFLCVFQNLASSLFFRKYRYVASAADTLVTCERPNAELSDLIRNGPGVGRPELNTFHHPHPSKARGAKLPSGRNPKTAFVPKDFLDLTSWCQCLMRVALLSVEKKKTQMWDSSLKTCDRLRRGFLSVKVSHLQLSDSKIGAMVRPFDKIFEYTTLISCHNFCWKGTTASCLRFGKISRPNSERADTMTENVECS